MKDLIERLRHNPSIELFAEAADALEQQAAVIEQMRLQRYNVLGVIADVESGDGFDDVCLKTLKMVAGNLHIRPCPEVLNKVRADAVMAACWACGGVSADKFAEYAERLLKGEK